MRLPVRSEGSGFPKEHGDLENDEVDYEEKNFGSCFKFVCGSGHDRLFHRIIE